MQQGVKSAFCVVLRAINDHLGADLTSSVTSKEAGNGGFYSSCMGANESGGASHTLWHIEGHLCQMGY